jgi:predicted TIM-barrel fold metal-dependent hydrolase
MNSGGVWVKLSAPYRLGRTEDRGDLRILIDAMAAHRPDRLLWGLDWPHTELWAQMPDDADLIDSLSTWLPEEELRHMVLVDNPSMLYWAR